MKISFIVLISLFLVLLSGCIQDETQGVEVTGDIGYSVGPVNDNRTDIQQIQWTTSVGNNGDILAKNVICKIILHPEVSSRLVSFEGNTMQIGDLKPDTWEGFKGNATFDASNTSKHELTNGEL